MLRRIHHRFRALALAGIAVLLVSSAPGAQAASGSGTITGAGTGITAGWRGSGSGAEFLARCVAAAASGGAVSALPARNGVGSWVIDLGSDRTGFVSTSAHIAPAPVGPAIPTPDPTGLVFTSPTYQLHNYDFDLYFVNSSCTQVGHATTQSSNEAGSITVPARYVVVLLAFNATGSPSVGFNYSAP